MFERVNRLAVALACKKTFEHYINNNNNNQQQDTKYDK